MVSKKINAVIALCISALLLFHNAFNSAMMIRGTVEQSPVVPARILFTLVAVHALISLYFLLVRRDGKGSSKRYASLCRATRIQRGTAIAMLPLICFHAFFHPPVMGIVPILINHAVMICLAAVHITVSIPNALISLGIISSSRAHGRARVVSGIVAGIMLVTGITAGILEGMAL